MKSGYRKKVSIIKKEKYPEKYISIKERDVMLNVILSVLILENGILL